MVKNLIGIPYPSGKDPIVKFSEAFMKRIVALFAVAVCVGYASSLPANGQPPQDGETETRAGQANASAEQARPVDKTSTDSTDTADKSQSSSQGGLTGFLKGLFGMNNENKGSAKADDTGPSKKGPQVDQDGGQGQGDDTQDTNSSDESNKGNAGEKGNAGGSQDKTENPDGETGQPKDKPKENGDPNDQDQAGPPDKGDNAGKPVKLPSLPNRPETDKNQGSDQISELAKRFAEARKKVLEGKPANQGRKERIKNELGEKRQEIQQRRQDWLQEKLGLQEEFRNRLKEMRDDFHNEEQKEIVNEVKEEADEARDRIGRD